MREAIKGKDDEHFSGDAEPVSTVAEKTDGAPVAGKPGDKPTTVSVQGKSASGKPGSAASGPAASAVAKPIASPGTGVKTSAVLPARPAATESMSKHLLSVSDRNSVRKQRTELRDSTLSTYRCERWPQWL